MLRKILDILEEYEIKATFFMVHNGNKVADEGSEKDDLS